MTIKSSLCLFLLFASAGCVHAECDKSAKDARKSYAKAVATVRNLPLVLDWQKSLPVSRHIKTAFLPAVDKQIVIRGKCYWEVTVYSDEATHLHRWQTFLVPVHSGPVLLENQDGDFIVPGKGASNAPVHPHAPTPRQSLR